MDVVAAYPKGFYRLSSGASPASSRASTFMVLALLSFLSPLACRSQENTTSVLLAIAFRVHLYYTLVTTPANQRSLKSARPKGAGAWFQFAENYIQLVPTASFMR